MANNFIHTTPNGSGLILSVDGGKIQYTSGTLINRVGVMTFLLQNHTHPSFNEKVMNWLEGEVNAARTRSMESNKPAKARPRSVKK